MLGRTAELGRIEALLAATRAGQGGSLLVRGEAGIGKTTLLAAACERAVGLRVMRTQGVETERQLPFAALAELLRDVVDRRDRLPLPQATALASALALEPPIAGDRYAVCVAAFGLLRLAAEETPLLVVVDDAHWLDAGTAECLAFVSRRLGGSRVSMLLAVRDPEGPPPGLTEVAELIAEPLEDAEARALLAVTAPGLASSVIDAVLTVAAGNPLALIEIASRLTPDERTGRATLPDPLRPAGRLAAMFERRIVALPDDTRMALLLAAAGGGDTGVIWRACAAAGVDPHALDPAESGGLISVEGTTLRFAHPLVRGAAYHVMSPAERRLAHRTLAGVVDGDRRAWHLADAALGPDEQAAEALQAAGSAAVARRACVEAAGAYERAAELTADAERRSRRLVRAGNAYIVAGELDRALSRLDEAAALGTSVAFDPRVMHTRSLLLLGTGSFQQGYAAMRQLAEAAVTMSDPVTAAHLLADTAMSALIAGDCRASLELAERAADVLGDGGELSDRANVMAALCAGRVFRGEGALARPALDPLQALVAQLDPMDWRVGIRIHALAIYTCAALDEYERARTIGADLLALLDTAGAVSARANPLAHVAEAGYRLGLWDLAWQESAEAIALAEETRADETLVRALVTRARLAGARGFETESRELAERALAIAERCGIGSIPPHAHQVLASLDLLAGRVEAAIARLEPLVAPLVGEHGLVHPTIIPIRPDLCEAYVMVGRLSDAAAQAEAVAGEAERVGGAVGRVVAARCRGLVADDFEPHFEQALELEAARPATFERARTLLAYGGRLHRARRREQARPLLREAEDRFAQLGATPWAERAAAELRAAGGVRRSVRPVATDELTSQEVRVVTAIARGLTIRAVAAELFLSPKTVDFHLRQVYGKLRIHSRAELAVVAVERGWARAAGDR